MEFHRNPWDLMECCWIQWHCMGFVKGFVKGFNGLMDHHLRVQSPKKY